MFVHTRAVSARTMRTVALLVVLASLLAGREAAALHEETFLSEARDEMAVIDLPYGVVIRTDGAFVVWEENTDVFAAPLGQHERLLVAGGSAYQGQPDIDTGIVVWEERRGDCPDCQFDIVAKDLATGTTFEIAATAATERQPSIDGDWVTYWTSDGESRWIAVRNIATMADPQTVAMIEDVDYVTKSIASDGWVLWAVGDRIQSAGPLTYDWMIFAQRIGTSAQITVARGQGSVPTAFAVSGNLALHPSPANWRELAVTDLTTGEVQTLSPGQHCRVGHLAVEGRYAIGWPCIRPFGARGDFWGIDLLTMSSFSISVAEDTSELPASIRCCCGGWERRFWMCGAGSWLI